MNKLTLEEFLVLYGDIKVKFNSYYKYSFTFKGTTVEGNNIFISVGGDHDSIYRFELSADREMGIMDLEPTFGWVKDSDGNTIVELEYQGW